MRVLSAPLRLSAPLLAALFAIGLVSSRASAETITLGMVVGTTGAFAGGEAPLVNGTKLAVEDLNRKGGIGGNKIELSIEDTGSEQTGAINAFNRVVGQSPVAIMDTTLSGFVLSQIGMIEDAGIPTLTGAASAQLAPGRKGVEALFRVRTNDELVAAAAARFGLDNLGAKKIAVLRINNEYGNGWLHMIEATLKERGLAPATVESYEGADRDLTPQLLRIRNVDADALIVVGDPPNQVVAVQQIRQLGVKAKVIVSNAGVLPTTIKLYQADASNGIYGTVDSLPAADGAHSEWSDRYRAAYHIEPDYSAAEYYDGVMMVAAAIAKVGTGNEALVKELRTVRDYAGIGNSYSFADKGDGGRSVAIVQLEDGKVKLAAIIK
ncbi:amino acid/amide ABC transporter substrate-binding protein, HAAT family [Rhizobiales bacterium GAS191]|nr:amino acid/amide ABC transporter substrate-binding protein, HAAT family [Rhizobiales bacterium GAS191]